MKILTLDKDVHCTFFDYTIIAEDRDNLKHFLEGKGIETKIKHSVLMNNQPAYDYLPKFDLPVADRLVNRILSLPIHEKLSQEDLEFIVQVVKDFYEKN